jgi:hypothetical protein
MIQVVGIQFTSFIHLQQLYLPMAFILVPYRRGTEKEGGG